MRFEMKNVTIGNITVANNRPFMLIAGPCQIENRDHAMMMAEKIAGICGKLGIPFIYKSSFDKANRSSLGTSRGIGIDEGLKILADVRSQFGCPVLTDVHDVEQVEIAGQVVDVLQIPAFLCRQTDLLLAAGKTGKAINVKKGQFLAPWDMKNVAAKIASTGNENILLCERGASFGYNTLVSDMRALPIMAQTGYPVIFDATHSVQQPGGQGTTSGGQREFAPVLARAACAVGVAGVFAETHQDPDTAPSDGPNMIRLEKLENVLRVLKQIDDFAKANPVDLAA
jgi:2-dehydro-3-deoxyphosphooctonate aldolase (KDO 8-P synthase)